MAKAMEALGMIETSLVWELAAYRTSAVLHEATTHDRATGAAALHPRETRVTVARLRLIRMRLSLWLLMSEPTRCS